MRYQIGLCLAGLVLLIACQSLGPNAETPSSQAAIDIEDCIRSLMTLDEGTWNYMGTIARMNGKFRTYETTSQHASAGSDMWSAMSYGGDIDDSRDSAERSYVKLVGNAIIPVEDGTLNQEAAIKYTSCKGPDAEGRYEATQEYSLPHTDGSRLSVKAIVWYSEYGSYFTEDIFDDKGRIIARRSGVNTPVEN